MSQHDMNIADQYGNTFLTDLNAALSALASTSSGGTEPPNPIAGMFWVDIGTSIGDDGPWVRQRNEDNTDWVKRFRFNADSDIESLIANSETKSTPNIDDTFGFINSVNGKLVKQTFNQLLFFFESIFSELYLAFVAPGTSGHVLTSNGTEWVSQAPSTGGLSASTTAEAQSGAINTSAITPLRLREGLNASGSAPIYACRAWVNFNGTGTVAIRASGNVSSITDNGVGDYTVNFATALPDANYAMNGANANINGGFPAVIKSASVGGAPVNMTTTACQVVTIYAPSSTSYDVTVQTLTFNR